MKYIGHITDINYNEHKILYMCVSLIENNCRKKGELLAVIKENKHRLWYINKDHEVKSTLYKWSFKKI